MKMEGSAWEWENCGEDERSIMYENCALTTSEINLSSSFINID